MEQSIPRIMIAGTGSGCGKTTVTCAVLQALKDWGLDAGSFKCGPDYIDPMFHAHILGIPSCNLDSFFFPENTLKYLLAKNGASKQICVIEGVMGFFDGQEMNSSAASSCEIAEITGTPVILVADAKGAARSVMAVLHGFLTFQPHSPIRGVILNRCTEMTYKLLAEAIRSRFGDQIKPLGFLPAMPECSLESRHLGLVTAQEVEDLTHRTKLLAAQAEKSIDLDGLIGLSREAPALRCEPVRFPEFSEKIRIAAAQDRAFCFYYADNLSALREMGAVIVPFSPLSDPALPENIHGLYLGGGYPELYAKELSENHSMLLSVREHLKKGLPCIAECGGFMYLTGSVSEYPMAGYLPGACRDTGKLTRFGYIRLKARKDNMLCLAGEEIPAHEFHYWDCTEPGDAFTAMKLSGRHWNCAVADEHLYAGFPHFHFYANPSFAVRFMEACSRYREEDHD